MLIFAYDFETQSLPLFDQPSDDPRQPHIVQAAAALVDSDTRKIITSIDLIAEPDGWNIPDEVAAIHGITTDIANQLGVPEDIIVNLMWRMWLMSDVRLGHNETFDARIMRIAMKRLGTGDPEVWKAGRAECTARLSSPIMKMAPTEKMRAAGRNHSKTPKLTEAYEFFTGRQLENAHSAMADVLGCLAVYWAIQEPAQAARAASIADAGGEVFERAKQAGRAAAHKQVKMPPAEDDGEVPFL